MCVGPLIKDYGACAVVDASLQESCQAETLTLQDITDTSMAQIATYDGRVPYAFIQSKVDDVQIAFYIAVGALTPNSKAFITPEQYYKEVNHVFEQYNSNPNFVNFMVTGDRHCFTPNNLMYTADTTGNDPYPCTMCSVSSFTQPI